MTDDYSNNYGHNIVVDDDGCDYDGSSNNNCSNFLNYLNQNQ
jgi:hypothetical protein